MRFVAATEPVTLWSTNPAAAKTLTANTNRWLTGGIGTGDWNADGQWYTIDLPDGAEFLQLQFESLLVNRGGFTGGTPGTTHMAILAAGYAWRQAFINPAYLALTPQATTAVISKLRGHLLYAVGMDHGHQAAVADAGSILFQQSVIHSGVAPTNGDTVIADLFLARRHLGAAAPGASLALSDASIGCYGMRRAHIAVTFNLGAAWNPASAADVLVDARLSYQIYTR